MRVTIIGGLGRMGKWFTQYFLKRGIAVTISDVREEEARSFANKLGIKFFKDNSKAIENSDLVIIATPIDITLKVIREISEKLKKNMVLMEITSIKLDIVKQLKKTLPKEVKILSVHPLFGPGLTEDMEMKLALIPIKDKHSEYRLVSDIFPKAKIVIVTAHKHDYAMALTISFPLFLNLVFAQIIGQHKISDLRDLSGTTFVLQLLVSEGVMSESVDLYETIHSNKKYCMKILSEFIMNSRKLMKQIAENRNEDFRKKILEIRKNLTFDEDFTNAYEKIYKILKIL